MPRTGIGANGRIARWKRASGVRAARDPGQAGPTGTGGTEGAPHVVVGLFSPQRGGGGIRLGGRDRRDPQALRGARVEIRAA